MDLGLFKQLTPLAALAVYHEETHLTAVYLFDDVLSNFSAFLDSNDFDSIAELFNTT